MGPAPSSDFVKISHKKDGHQRALHRFHVSFTVTAGSATELLDKKYVNNNVAWWSLKR